MLRSAEEVIFMRSTLHRVPWIRRSLSKSATKRRANQGATTRKCESGSRLRVARRGPSSFADLRGFAPLGWVLLAGCAGTQPVSSAGSLGMSPRPAETTSASAGHAVEAEGPAAMARLTARIVMNGEPIAGKVRIEDANGQTVAEGVAGHTFAMPAGRYRVFGEVTDASILADTPTREAEDPAILEPGESVTHDVEMGQAQIRLSVIQNGRRVRVWRMELRRPGADETILELTPSTRHVSMSPGRYEGVMHVRGDAIQVSGLIFMGGATQDIPVRLR